MRKAVAVASRRAYVRMDDLVFFRVSQDSLPVPVPDGYAFVLPMDDNELRELEFRETEYTDESSAEETSEVSSSPCSCPMGGFDCSLLEKQPGGEDFVCSICHLLLRDPVLTSCCGNHFCQSCIYQVRLSTRQCPLCNEHCAHVMLDKFFQRKINDQDVSCPFSKHGCKWEGKLRQVETHIDEGVGECSYIEGTCTYCEELLPMCKMAEHKAEKCPLRPHSCQYCGLKETHRFICNTHLTECEKHPVECPKKCGTTGLVRGSVEPHLDTECPLREVSCKYDFAGCEFRALRRDMEAHVKGEVQNHLSLVAAHNQDLQMKMEWKEARIRRMEKELQVQGGDIETLKTVLCRLEVRIAAISPVSHKPGRDFPPIYHHTIPPLELVMTDLPAHLTNRDQWFSEPFYSNIRGYKLCLSAFANGVGIGAGTHVSVFVNMMKGDYDSSLVWPFAGKVAVTICYSDTEQSQVFEAEEDSPRHFIRKAVRQVKSGERNVIGFGNPECIPHWQLTNSCTCIVFRVTRVERK